MGKSHLLRALAGQGRGLYHQALEEQRAPALGRIGALVASEAALAGGSIRFDDWPSALRALIDRAGVERTIILDEFPYLLAQAPELPSAIQAAFDDARLAQAPPFRLLLCGSAMSVMSELPSGQKALRGRAVLDLSLRPFDYRQSASFWGISDPETAFLVHSVVGGTPGYRSLLDGRAPSRPGQLVDWLTEGVLNPSHAMFREADYLLTEDPAISDRALYQSVLGAIADGHSTRSGVGGVLRKDDSSLRHPLLVLERAGFIRRDQDLWRSRRPLLRLDDPYLRFHHAVVRPDLAAFEARETAAAWGRAASTFASRVLGPHFEQLARTWTERFASTGTLGGHPAIVGWTQVHDAAARSRLERGRELLGARADVSRAKLLLFSRAGFSRGLAEVARSRPNVELIDLERLYHGD